MVCRVNDLTTSVGNSCITVNSREDGGINVCWERSLIDDLSDASFCTMSTRNIHIFERQPGSRVFGDNFNVSNVFHRADVIENPTLALTHSAIFCRSNLKLRRFRDDGPYFDSLTVVEGGAAFGYLHRLFNTVCLNEERCDRFLGLCQWVIRHGVPRDNLIVAFQRVPTFEYPLNFSRARTTK